MKISHWARLSALAASAGAALIGFIQSGAGAVLRTLRDKVREGVVTPEDFGAVGDGVADDTAAIIAALDWLDGRVLTPTAGKIYRLTGPLSDTSASAIRICSGGDAFISHTIIDAAQLNDDPLYRVTGSGTPGASVQVSDAAENAYMLSVAPGVPILKCDGCNLIGAPDTGSMNGAPDILRQLQGVVVWGVNGARQGVYLNGGGDKAIKDCAFALFEHCGYLQRGGITAKLERVAFVDCGWDVAASGAVGYPNTYTSGCAVLVVSNVTAGDYTTINGGNRATTFGADDVFIWTRGDTANNKSGLRGIQAGGLFSGKFTAIGSYTGHFFNVCQVSFDGYHIENYQSGGLVAGDLTPMCAYFQDSQPNIGQGFVSLVGAGITAGLPVFVHSYTGQSWAPSYSAQSAQLGRVQSIGPSYSSMEKLVLIATPGGTDTYTFKDQIAIGAGAGSKGFIGQVFAQLIQGANGNNFSRGAWVVGSFYGSAAHVLTPAQLAYESTVGGAYGAALSVSFVGNDLVVSVAWGANWPVSDVWILDVGLFGAQTASG